VEETQWHRLVAWGKLLILWRNLQGKEIAIEGNTTGVMMTKWREALRN
jgi:single-stranded DNA-binding protein